MIFRALFVVGTSLLIFCWSFSLIGWNTNGVSHPTSILILYPPNVTNTEDAKDRASIAIPHPPNVTNTEDAEENNEYTHEELRMCLDSMRLKWLDEWNNCSDYEITRSKRFCRASNVRWSTKETISLLRNKRIWLMGDSMTRRNYFAIVRHIRNGKMPDIIGRPHGPQKYHNESLNLTIHTTFSPYDSTIYKDIQNPSFAQRLIEFDFIFIQTGAWMLQEFFLELTHDKNIPKGYKYEIESPDKTMQALSWNTKLNKTSAEWMENFLDNLRVRYSIWIDKIAKFINANGLSHKVVLRSDPSTHVKGLNMFFSWYGNLVMNACRRNFNLCLPAIEQTLDFRTGFRHHCLPAQPSRIPYLVTLVHMSDSGHDVDSEFLLTAMQEVFIRNKKIN
mmetsp:Transcript_2366/g.3377  ORF Transcript_2366/g.3377 Transcript_2366/m.3377 type:complete len:391 (-) Transcript_2366:8-1180(-)